MQTRVLGFWGFWASGLFALCGMPAVFSRITKLTNAASATQNVKSH